MSKKNHLPIRLPIRYLPPRLSKRDKIKQLNMLLKSKEEYKRHNYYTRKKVASYPHRRSSHLRNVRNIYGIDKIAPNAELAKKTGCSVNALKQIVKKGEGAYYSSGSRPNQTAQSWGLARLASSVTGGKSALVDADILANGCNHSGKAFQLIAKSKEKYGYGWRKTRKITV
jgi:hypothetical protein